MKLCEYCKINQVKTINRRFCSKSCSAKWRVINDPSLVLRKFVKGYANWCDGLTKDTDVRVKKISDFQIEYNKDPKVRMRKREYLLDRIKNGLFGNGGLNKENSLVGLKQSKSRIAFIQNHPESIEAHSILMKKKWLDPKYVKAQMKARHVKPNKTELKLEKIIGSYGFWFVGDGKLIISGKCPDYWNGNYKLIELYGNYWHKEDNPQDRIDYFAKFGYETLVIWGNELKDEQGVRNRINNFLME